MTDIDEYLAHVATRLQVPARQRDRILEETRDHLDDATTALLGVGTEPGRAVDLALESFGPPDFVAAQFNADAGARAMKRVPAVLCAAGFAVFAGLVAAAKPQPRGALPPHASVAAQLCVFAAVVAFQIAVVAGVCSGSRALSVWRACASRPADRVFVRRAGTVGAAAVAVAATGWTGAVALQFGRAAHPDTAAAVVGGGVMLVAAISGLATVLLIRVNGADEGCGDNDAGPETLAVGERVVSFVRDHPVAACTTAALFGGATAMSHAETSVTGALLWGVPEAVAVVVSFVVLGPTLGLRRRIAR